MKTYAHTAGFTLIEMMIALLILAILSLMIVPIAGNFGIREQINETLKVVEPLKTPIDDYWNNNHEFPEDNEAAGLPNHDKLIGNYFTNVQVMAGAMHVHFGNKAHGKLRGKILSLRPMYVEDSVMSPTSWSCGYSRPPAGMIAAGMNLTTVDKKLLPVACRDIAYKGEPE